MMLSIEGGLAFLPEQCTPLETPIESVHGQQQNTTSFSIGPSSSLPIHNTEKGNAMPVNDSSVFSNSDLCYFWSFETNSPVVSMVWGRLTPVSLELQIFPSCSSLETMDEGFPRIVAYSVHPITKELLVLDTTRSVTLCSLVDNTLQQRALTSLQTNPSEAIRHPKGRLSLAYHQLSILIFDASGCRFEITFP